MKNKYIILISILMGLLLILMIIILSNLISFPPKLNCSDGTFYNHCAYIQPFYCFNGTLVENSSECGCPYDFKIVNNSCEKIKRCDDKTIYLECSVTQPKFCFDGDLINKSSVCGCPFEFITQNDNCISIYKLKPKNISLKYILRGKETSIKFEVYQGLNDYLSDLSLENYYNPSWEEFIMDNLNEEKQKEQLLLLVDKIKKEATDINDQARIAISLVQHIPYNKDAADFDEIEYKYPYETIYDKVGVCGDKSILLGFLLRELGFGVVTFDFELERHRAVGVSCSDKYDYYNTGYCFIESTTPNIITDSEGDYGGGDTLSIPSEIVYISNGTSFNAEEEYYDSKRLNWLYTSLEDYNEDYDTYNDYLKAKDDYDDAFKDYENTYKEMVECWDQVNKDHDNNFYEDYDDYSNNYDKCEEGYDDAYNNLQEVKEEYDDAYDTYDDSYDNYDKKWDEWENLINKYGIHTE